MAQYLSNGTKLNYKIDDGPPPIYDEKDIDYLIDKCKEKYADHPMLDGIIERVNTWGYMALDSSKTNKYDGMIANDSIDNCELAILRDPVIIPDYENNEDNYLCQETACKGFGDDGLRQIEPIGGINELNYQNGEPIREINNDDEFQELLHSYDRLYSLAIVEPSDHEIARYYHTKIIQLVHCKMKGLHICRRREYIDNYSFDRFTYVPNQGSGDCLWVAVCNYLKMERSNPATPYPRGRALKDRARELRRFTINWMSENRHHVDTDTFGSLIDLETWVAIQADGVGDPIKKKWKTGSIKKGKKEAVDPIQKTTTIVFDNYISYMKRDTSWGGQFEIYALSKHLKRSIIVLGADNKLFDRYRSTNSTIIPGTIPIYLYTNANFGVEGDGRAAQSARAGSHYEVLYPKSKGIPVGFENSIHDNVRNILQNKWICETCKFENAGPNNKCSMCDRVKRAPLNKYAHGEDNYGELYKSLIDMGIEDDVAHKAIVQSKFNEDNTMLIYALRLTLDDDEGDADDYDEDAAINCTKRELNNRQIVSPALCSARSSVRHAATTISFDELKTIANDICQLRIPAGITKRELCNKLFK